MEVYQSRLDSFHKSRRVKHATTKRTATVKWPHAGDIVATPDALAEAGFYWSPTYDDRDNVACFLCGKELAGWEPDDDPLSVHYDRCAEICAWAMLRCGLSLDQDRKGSFVFKDPSRHPASKAAEKARLTTFKTNGWWPHDSVKGHGASSTKMAKAGFVYTPQAPGDDTATCLYCSVSLSGWEEEDDPLDEHRKRETKSSGPCPFFSDPPSTGKALGRSSSTRSSSTQPRPRAGSRRPQSVVSDGDSDDANEPAPAAVPKKRTRTTSTTSTSEVGSLRRSTRRAPTVEPDVGDGADFGRLPAAGGAELGRSTRSRKLGKAPAERIEAIAEAEESEEETQRPRGAKTTKGARTEPKKPGRKAKAKVASEEEAEEGSETKDDEVVAKKVKAKAKVKVRDSEPYGDDDDSEAEEVPPAPVPTKSRVKKPAPKRAPSPPAPEDGDEDLEVPAPAKTRTRKPSSAAKSKATAQEAITRTRKPSSSTAKQKPLPIVSEDSGEDDALPDGTRAQVAGGGKPLPSLPSDQITVPDSDAEMQTAEEQSDTGHIPLRSSKAKAREGSAVPSREGTHAPVAERRISPLPAPRSRAPTASSTASKVPPSVASSIPEGRNRIASDSSTASKAVKKSKAKTRIPREEDAAHDSMPVSPPASPKRAIEAFRPPARAADALRSPSPPRPPRSPQRPPPSPVRSFTRGSPRPPSSPERNGFRAPSSVHAPSTPPRAPTSPPPSSSLPSFPSQTSSTALPIEEDSGPLNAEDRALTVEEWIRREMDVQYEQLRLDGEALIHAFQKRAEEARAQIAAM